jgi:uncharacterized repeat protein (TIGR02543 family)
MKKTVTLCIGVLLSTFTFGQERINSFCPEPINQEFENLSPFQIEEITKQYSSASKTILKIPIVFHILTNDPSGVSNISDCIIQNQVTILNNCFRKVAGTQGANTNPVGADTGIEFFLPCKDGNGNTTTGIIRTNTANCNYTTLDNTTQLNNIKTASSGANNFPNNKFLNVWVVKTMPNSNNVKAQAWWGNTNSGASRAGIVIHYSYLGSKNSGCPNIGYLDITGYDAYNLGTTLVHEAGHFFSLAHTYGSTCSYSDGCGDTPAITGLPNPYCGTNNNTKGVCVTGQTRMWQNYLDYADDACVNIFTQDQATKMQNYIANTSNYISLSSSTNVASVSCGLSNLDVSTSSNPSAGGTTTGGGSYANGASVTVTAAANSGYTFTNWTVNGSQVSTSTSYTFIISANRNLVANFSQNVTNFNITTTAAPTAGGTTTGGGSYANGASVTVAAIANSGYTFTNWTVNGSQVSTSTSYTFIISANRSLVANFTQNSNSIYEVDESNRYAFSIFPNPVSSALTIKVSNENIKEVKIFNVLGEQINLVEDLHSQEVKLNISNQMDGVYFVQIKLMNDVVLIRKVIKL